MACENTPIIQSCKSMMFINVILYAADIIAVRRMHVDTALTHVVSAIINVDQDVEEPWELLILDHLHQEHSLVMAPGDMV